MRTVASKRKKGRWRSDPREGLFDPARYQVPPHQPGISTPKSGGKREPASPRISPVRSCRAIARTPSSSSPRLNDVESSRRTLHSFGVDSAGSIHTRGSSTSKVRALLRPLQRHRGRGCELDIVHASRVTYQSPPAANGQPLVDRRHQSDAGRASSTLDSH